MANVLMSGLNMNKVRIGKRIFSVMSFNDIATAKDTCSCIDGIIKDPDSPHFLLFYNGDSALRKVYEIILKKLTGKEV